MHGLNAYNPHKAIHNTKNPKTQNFKNDFDVDKPSLNIDHQSNNYPLICHAQTQCTKQANTKSISSPEASTQKGTRQPKP